MLLLKPLLKRLRGRPHGNSGLLPIRLPAVCSFGVLPSEWTNFHRHAFCAQRVPVSIRSVE